MSSIMNRLGFLAVSVVALSFAASMAAAGQDPEFYVRTMRTVGTNRADGVRTAAMGGASTGIADGVASITENPGGLGAFTGKGVDVGLGFDWLDDGNDNADQTTFRLGGAMSLGEYLPAGAKNQAVGGYIGTQRYSGAAGVGMGRDETDFVLGYGVHLMDDLIGGVAVGLYDGSWSAGQAAVPFDRSYTGGEIRVGGIYRVEENLTVGAVAGYSIGSYRDRAAYAANADGNSLERWDLRVGAAYQMSDYTLLAGDLWYDHMKTDQKTIVAEKNNSWGLSVGVEQQVLPDILALRGGLYYERNSYSSDGSVRFVDGGSYSKGRFGFTAGAGLKFRCFDIGYALDVNSGGDIKNTLDLGAEW